jgi:ribosomal protein L13E
MSMVEKIEQDIEGLSSKDFDRLAVWVDRRRKERWDRQMDEDVAAGRLDFLFEEAEAGRQSGKLRDWPQPP